jgi:hypothetical protein
VDVTAYLQAGCGYYSRVLHVGAVCVCRSDGSLFGVVAALVTIGEP